MEVDEFTKCVSKTTPVWYVKVLIDGDLYARGKGNTKKAARNEAAKVGLERLGIKVWCVEIDQTPSAFLTSCFPFDDTDFFIC